MGLALRAQSTRGQEHLRGRTMASKRGKRAVVRVKRKAAAARRAASRAAARAPGAKPASKKLRMPKKALAKERSLVAAEQRAARTARRWIGIHAIRRPLVATVRSSVVGRR